MSKTPEGGRTSQTSESQDEAELWEECPVGGARRLEDFVWDPDQRWPIPGDVPEDMTDLGTPPEFPEVDDKQ